MRTINRPSHYRSKKTELVQPYYVRMNADEKRRIIQIAKSLKMKPSKLLRLAIADTIKEYLLY